MDLESNAENIFGNISVLNLIYSCRLRVKLLFQFFLQVLVSAHRFVSLLVFEVEVFLQLGSQFAFFFLLLILKRQQLSSFPAFPSLFFSPYR